MKTRYSHLTLADRRQIERWRLMKMSATIIEALRALPLAAHRSVAFDRGSEFVDWPHLQTELGARNDLAFLRGRISATMAFTHCL